MCSVALRMPLQIKASRIVAKGPYAAATIASIDLTATIVFFTIVITIHHPRMGHHQQNQILDTAAIAAGGFLEAGVTGQQPTHCLTALSYGASQLSYAPPPPPPPPAPFCGHITLSHVHYALGPLLHPFHHPL